MRKAHGERLLSALASQADSLEGDQLLRVGPESPKNIFNRATYRLRAIDIAASGFDRLRAHSMNTVASGLNVRFFNVTIPTGRDGTGNSMGRALSARRLPLNLKNNQGRIARSRPMPKTALCNEVPYPPTAIVGTATPFSRKPP